MEARAKQYFSIRPGIIGQYESSCAVVKKHGCRNVGLYLGYDDWEYPLWVLLKANMGRPPVISHIGVKNPTRNAETEGTSAHGPPDCIISLKPALPRAMVSSELRYQQVWASEPVRVYVRLPEDD